MAESALRADSTLCPTLCISNCALFLYSSFLTKKISTHMFVTPSRSKYFSLNNVFPSPPHRVIEPGLHHNIGVVCTFISTLPCYFFSTLRLQRGKTKPLWCFFVPQSIIENAKTLAHFTSWISSLWKKACSFCVPNTEFKRWSCCLDFEGNYRILVLMNMRAGVT